MIPTTELEQCLDSIVETHRRFVHATRAACWAGAATDYQLRVAFAAYLNARAARQCFSRIPVGATVSIFPRDAIAARLKRMRAHHVSPEAS